MATTTAQNKILSRTKTFNIKKKIDDFWDWCKQNDYIPDTEILCKYLNVNRSTLWRWEIDEDNSNLCNLIKNVKNDIFAYKKQLAMRGKMNATIFIFDAKNNHGYVDKIEHEHNNNTNITVSFNIPKLETTLPTKTIEGVVIESTPIKDI